MNSFRTHLLSILGFATLVACGGNHGDKKVADYKNTYNGPVECTCARAENTKWTVTSTNKLTSQNYALKINNSEFINTCYSTLQTSTLKFEDNKTIIQFSLPLIPTNGFKFDIVDLGEDCKNNAIFYSGRPIFGTTDIRTGRSASEYQVFVDLDV